MEAHDWNFTNYANESASYYCPGVTPNNLYGVQEFTDLMLNPVIKGHDILPPDVIETLDFSNLDPFIQSIQDNWQEVLKQNSALMAMVVFGLLVAVLLPISGIIACVTYCCCGCSKKAGTKQKTDSLCFCIEGFIYFLLLVLGWLGVAWLVVSDLAMQKGIDQLPERFDGFVNDTSKYVNLTVDEVDNFAIHNLDELMLYFNATLDEAGDLTKELVDHTLTAINFDEIEGITNFISNISHEFVEKDKENSIVLLDLLSGDVNNISKSLQGVVDGLNNIKNDDNCKSDPTDACVNIVAGLSDSMSDIIVNLGAFSAIDDAKTAIEDINVDLTQIDQMVELISGANESLHEFSEKFVNDFTQDISNDILNITDDIKTQVTDLTEQLKNIDLSNTDAIMEIEQTIENFAGYTDIILYATLVPAIILGIALLFSCFGLILGCFGSTGGGAKRTGSSCLCGSNSILLISGFFLWMITTLLFLVGGMSDKLVCQMLEDPKNSELYNATTSAFDSLFHDILNIDNIENQTFKYDEIIDSCGNNGSIYNVFHLDLVYNITELENWQETYNISEISDQVLEAVGNGITDLVESMKIDEDIEKGINDIAKQFSELTSKIFDDIKDINISSLVPESDLQNVTENIKIFTDLGVKPDFIEEVELSINETQTILSEDVEDHFNLIVNFVNELDKELKYPEDSTCDVGCAVTLVLDLADNATKIINTTSRSEILTATNSTITNITDLVDDFVTFGIGYVRDDVGTCKPIHDMYNAFTITFCDNLLGPINSIWTSIGVAIFFMLPAMAIARCMILYFNKKPVNYCDPYLDDDSSILRRSIKSNAPVHKHYTQDNYDPHRAANTYLQRQQEQQHNQQFYQPPSLDSPDMNRNGATPNHIPLATLDNQHQYVPYQHQNNMETTQHYRPDQYQYQQQPTLKMKNDR